MLPPPIGEFVDVSGRRLWCRSAGAGAPSVVFLPGAGLIGLDYTLVADAVSKFTTAVIYDRGGTGFSEAAPLPRSADDVVSELRESLRVLRAPTPYVLVGHGIGSLYVRRYTQRYPGDVAGVVLLDPLHERYEEYVPADVIEMQRGFDDAIQALPDELPAGVRDFCRWIFGAALEDWPPLLRDTLVEVHSSHASLDAAVRESASRAALYRALRRDGGFPDGPTKILSSTEVDEFKRARHLGGGDELLQAELLGKHRLYLDLAAELTQGEVRAVKAGNTTMPFREPGAVAEAVMDLVAATSAAASPDK